MDASNAFNVNSNGNVNNNNANNGNGVLRRASYVWEIICLRIYYDRYKKQKLSHEFNSKYKIHMLPYL